MADQEHEGAAQEPEGKQVDWQAKYEAMRQHSRDWEQKAKANQSAADELEKLQEASKTEQQRANERAEKAEAELADLRAAQERSQAVSSVADKAGVPTELVQMLNGKDAEELAAQVARIKKLLPAYPTRTDDGGGQAAAKKTNADRFAETLFGTD